MAQKSRWEMGTLFTLISPYDVYFTSFNLCSETRRLKKIQEKGLRAYLMTEIQVKRLY